MARPKQCKVEALRLHKVKHVAFHQGVQFNGKVFSSLNADVHEKNGIDMHVLSNGCLSVKMNVGKGDEEWIIGSGMWHYAKLEPLKEDAE